MLQFTFLFLCEFQDCGDKFHQPGNEHFALSLTSGCYDYCAYILQQAVVSEVIIYSRLFILFTLQSGNIHNIHKLIVGVHAMDGQSPSKECWLLKPKNGLDNKSSKITHPFQMNPYWPGKKTHSSNPHLRKSGPGKPQNAGRFSGGVTCLLVLPQGNLIYHTTSHNKIVYFIFDLLISLKGELLVGCGDGEVVMVVEGVLKKPPPGRVTFPTQVRRKLLTDNQW